MHCFESIARVTAFLVNDHFYICICISSQEIYFIHLSGPPVFQTHYFPAHCMCFYWVLMTEVNILRSVYLKTKRVFPEACFQDFMSVEVTP